MMKDREEEELEKKLSGQLIMPKRDDLFPLRDEGVTVVECPVEAVDDHIIIVRGESQNKVGVLHITERTGQKTRPFMGEIRSVGPAAPQYLKTGQTVIYHEYGQVTIYPFGIEYVAIRARDVICIMREEFLGQRKAEEREGSTVAPEGDEEATKSQEGEGGAQE